ncbi:hypothetical protein BO70DRAFT_425449 [Aspergillus heteromorphus CBS 117.55]|uniref:Rhodopsin domain-containing protein n=1 Tax=Aspergillus heteromorphus CBS 117.55 TaxID=1448321 RepID=A0A317X2K0_9EURO|nr:uncharacterized protein BO70DRAFT_425449 [Aspergillus heteromorphus CBS 117.55]PWY92783.1 hypothetical protein BO70DRAFT_425449 [Aspergillus heteromorphus CBS 117.55]
MYALPVAITFLCLATVVVVLRLVVRLYVLRKPGWDDLLIGGSLIVDIIFFAFLVLEIKYGLGRNLDELSAEELQLQLKSLYATIILYNTTLTLTKLSLIVLYRRLFPPKGYQILLSITLCIVLATGTWMIFSAILFCIPVRAFWDTSIPHTCLSQDVVWGLNAALQITTDLGLVVIPLPILARLKLPMRQRVALMGVFGLGFLTTTLVIVIVIVIIINMIININITAMNTTTVTITILTMDKTMGRSMDMDMDMDMDVDVHVDMDVNIPTTPTAKNPVSHPAARSSRTGT